MTTEQPPAPQGSRRKRVLLLSFLGFAVVMLLIGIIGALADTDDDESKNTAAGSSTRASATTSARAAAPATTTAAPAAPATTTAAPPIVPPPPAAPAVVPGAARSPRCQPVPDRYLAAVNASFTNSRYTLANTWAINGSDGVWIGGHIMDGDKRVSSADVWYAKGAAVWSLSGGARRNSQLPDGRHILNLSAGDDDGIAVQGCVTAR